MEAMKTVMEAFQARYEEVMKMKREKTREIKAQRQRILIDCIKAATRNQGEKEATYKARVGSYMEEFQTKEKPNLLGSKIGKMKVQIDPHILAIVVLQNTKIFEEQEEGKEQLEFGKESQMHLTD